MSSQVKDWEKRKELGHEHWWDMYVDNLETADLEEICHQVLDLYIQQPTPAKDAADSPPQPGTPGSTANSSLSQSSRQSSIQNSENKVRLIILIDIKLDYICTSSEYLIRI